MTISGQVSFNYLHVAFCLMFNLASEYPGVNYKEFDLLLIYSGVCMQREKKLGFYTFFAKYK